MEFRFTFLDIEGKGKIPKSKYNDGTFDFYTIYVKRENLPEFFSKKFWLSAPLKENYVRCRRTKEELKYSETRDYVVLDIDGITEKSSMLRVIDYFLNNDYPVLLVKSRSFNGETNFNMKGIFLTKEEDKKSVLLTIQEDLKNFCKIDLSCERPSSYQAPTLNSDLLIDNLDGIGQIKIKSINKIVENFQSSNFELNFEENDKKDEILQKCLEIFYSKGFRLVNTYKKYNRILTFSHPSEVKSKNGYFLFEDTPFIMYHHNPEKKPINIFKEFMKSEEGKKYIQLKIENFIRGKRFKYKKHIKTDNLKIDEQKRDIIELFLNDKENSCLKIKSYMGSGKSNIIEYILKEATKKKIKRILIISNRVNSAFEFSNRFGLKTYLDEETYLSGDSIIVQFESLHKYDLRNFDLVILDEFISLLLQNASNLSKNSLINSIKFERILSNKRIVILDAFLTGFENEFLRNKDSVYFIENTSLDEVPVSLVSSEKIFFEILLKCDEPFSLSCSSLKMAKKIKNILQQTGKKILFLSSETPVEERRLILKKLSEKDFRIDVLIFTPTITVGVNILCDFKKHFHYDSGTSCDIISSIQMTKRSRLAQEIIIYDNERKFGYSDFDSRKWIIDFEKMDQLTLKEMKTFSFDENGNPELNRDVKFLNKIECINNLFTCFGGRKVVFRRFLKENFKNIKEFELKDRKTPIRNLKINKDLEVKKVNFETILNSLCNYINIDKIKEISEEIKTIQELQEIKRYFIFFREDEKKKQERLTELIFENLPGLNFYRKFLKLVCKYTLKESEWYLLSELQKDEIFILSKIGFKKKNNRMILENQLIKKLKRVN